LYTKIFLFPKPIIASLNGHTIAGGCMLADACDFRIMVSGKAKISLNEITFGASVFTGSVEILKFCVGCRNAEEILITGAMYPAEKALNLGLINQISNEENLVNDAHKAAEEYAQKDAGSFAAIKSLLRQPIVDSYIDNEKKSIDEFTGIWYSESTQKQLEQIKIHS
jgi:enoyl-CoA hydratase/carnithine racemase